MTSEQFDAFLDYAIELCRDTMKTKAGEYAIEDSRFYNFICAGSIKRETPEKALWGMYVKHLVSVIDIVEAVEAGKDVPRDHYTEKLKDSIVYHLLFWGMLEGRVGEGYV